MDMTQAPAGVDSRETAHMTIFTHVAIFSNNEGQIQGAGPTAEAALEQAITNTGADASDFIVHDVSERMGAALAAGETPTRWGHDARGRLDLVVLYPVLNDCTVDAWEIGQASTAEEAADVYVAYISERSDDIVERPEFQICTKLSSNRPNVDPEAEAFFEPIF